MDAMTFIDIPEPGPATAMVLSSGPVPACADDEVLIRVHAAGVNRPDVLQRMGLYPPPPDASPLLGLEVAGEVVACGSAVSRWQPGDSVCALTNGGGYASYATAPAGQCLPIPAGLSMQEAASLPETLFTVWSNIVERARLQAGESLLVHGGSSGIGVTAIQLARALGATVFATAGSDQKCEACVSLGADRAINYRREDFVEVVRTLTDNRGVDIILDMVGGEYIQRNISAAALEGRIVNIAYLNGPKATVNFMPVMLKRLTLTGSTLRPQSKAYKASVASALLDTVWPLIEDGRFRPVVFKCFPLAAAAEAHQLMESNQHIGKIVLTIDH